MKVTIRLFASLREALDRSTMSLKLAEGATVRDALEQLRAHDEALKIRLGTVHVALNRRYVSPDEKLHDGDELAIIPPVGGG